ncbi:MAG: GH92 family glycosyl hydrolase [Kiritimatiellae bacterium]|nr:GH92 family glycosyl hydrolase [Kiritimatiellia bacterium]
MKSKKTVYTAMVAVTMAVGFQIRNAAAADLTQYVLPLMGTDSNFGISTGNVYPAIARPWGMNTWTPQTGENGNGWTYTYTNNKIRGIKQTHQPSPWINDYGQFSILPVTGKPVFDQNERASWFSHKAEKALPYYYRVYLADHDTTVELTPTERAAIIRVTYPQTDQPYFVVDAFDKGSFIRLIPEKRQVVGYSTRNSGGVMPNFRNYFVLQFDRPFADAKVWKDKSIQLGVTELAEDHVGAIVKFAPTAKGDRLHVRVASSFISEEQAIRNLGELGNDDFDTVCAKGQQIWNETMGRITVEGGTLDQFRTFYTCLYRALLFPRRLYEIGADGKPVHYSPHNGRIEPGYYFTDTGFWDTFRSLFPLLNFAYPEMNAKMTASLENYYRESGWLPEWASPGHRGCMIGNNSASVVADAWLTGARGGYSIEKLYEAMLHGANNVHPSPFLRCVGRWGHKEYNTLGYVPRDVGVPESAARTLEFAYDDWCIWKVAVDLKRPKEEIDLYAKRCQNYKNLFHPTFKLMAGRNKDGTFDPKFNPLKWGGDFTEGNSLHYTWSVFHDIQGLIDLMGGKEAFVKQLDAIFTMKPDFDESAYGGVIHEIREMQIMNFGQYAHGNQPIQHMIYLYAYAGEPWKTQHWVREVMERLYTPTADGYCGDEDNGQTSAWYVWSALGFYPVCPGSGEYVMGAPMFPKATVSFPNGKQLVITAPQSGSAQRYIQSATLNGKPYGKNFLKLETLRSGATLEMVMGEKPNTSRGTAPDDAPYSFSRNR